MAITIRKASRSRVYLKLAVQGPSGSGKSYSALKIARGLVGPEGKIGAIDTENGSISLYSHLTDFDVADLADFAPETYVEAIKAFEEAGYDCLIIDSISHAWKFILDQKAALDARGGNGMMNWKGPKEKYAKLTTAVLQSKMHIIGCMRAKTEYVQNEGNKGYSKAGLAAIAEPDSEFEYTVVFSMGMDHRALCGVDGQGKDRTGIFDRLGAFSPSEKTGETLSLWLQDAPEQTFRSTDVQVSTASNGTTRVVSGTAAYLRDTMQFDGDKLNEYKNFCTGNGFESKDVTPVLMALEDKTLDNAKETVAIMVGLRDLGIEPTIEAVVSFVNGVNVDSDGYLEILDQAAKAGIPDLDALLEFMSDPEGEPDDSGGDPGDGNPPVTAAPVEPVKPTGGRRKAAEVAA